VTSQGNASKKKIYDAATTAVAWFESMSNKERDIFRRNL